MFVKGMKYEIRAVARILLPMFIVFLCAAMIMSVGFILDGRIFHLTQNDELGVLTVLFGLAEGLVGMGLVLLMVAINIAVFVMIVHRFYVSFFTDEGYLTFTLPLTIDCHLMIKIASMFLWSMCSLIVTSIGILIIFGGLSIGYADFIKEFLPEFKYVFEMMWESMVTELGWVQILLWIVSAVVASVFQSLLLYFAISLGCMIFKKNRLLGAIISVFCIDGLYSFITQFGSSLLMVLGVVSQIAFLVASIIGIAISVAGIIGMYCATKHILERKLNLD